jgi:transcriptional regulator with XRE-family HTH domain
MIEAIKSKRPPHIFLREWRKKHEGLSQERLGERIGANKAQVSNWESGERQRKKLDGGSVSAKFQSELAAIGGDEKKLRIFLLRTATADIYQKLLSNHGAGDVEEVREILGGMEAITQALSPYCPADVMALIQTKLLATITASLALGGRGLGIGPGLRFAADLKGIQIREAKALGSETSGKVGTVERNAALDQAVRDEAAAQKKAISMSLEFAEIIRPSVVTRLDPKFKTKKGYPSASTIRASAGRIAAKGQTNKS